MLKYIIEQGEFDEQRWLLDLQKNLDVFRDVAARVFIRATFARVPTWSGASRASLIPLSDLVNVAKGGSIPGPLLPPMEQLIKPVAFSPRDFKVGDKHHGISAGFDRGKQSKIFDRDKIAGFLFVTSVFQYWLLEEEWDSIPFGDSALQAFIVKRFGDVFPEWSKSIKITRRKLS